MSVDQAIPATLLVRSFPTQRPTIVCLCGSSRFYEAFQKANYDLTMKGCIVLSIGFYPHSKAKNGHGEGVGHDSAEKLALDELHKRKIDLADAVLVLNVDHYTGDSTRSEITYAYEIGRPVHYLEDGWTFGTAPIGTVVPGSGTLTGRTPHPTPDSDYGHFTFERDDGEFWHRGGSFTERVPVAMTSHGLIQARKTNWFWLPRGER